MRQYDLEKPIQPRRAANNDVRSAPKWSGLKREEQRRFSLRPTAFRTGPSLNRQARLGLVVAGVGLTLVVLLFFGPENVGSPGPKTTPNASPQVAQLGVLYISSKIQLNNGPVLAGLEGLFVTEVKPDSPASRAGVQSGDLITRMNDRFLQSDDSLLLLLSEYRPGDNVRLEVWRNGKPLQIMVTLG